MNKYIEQFKLFEHEDKALVVVGTVLTLLATAFTTLLSIILSPYCLFGLIFPVFLLAEIIFIWKGALSYAQFMRFMDDEEKLYKIISEENNEP